MPANNFLIQSGLTVGNIVANASTGTFTANSIGIGVQASGTNGELKVIGNVTGASFFYSNGTAVGGGTGVTSWNGVTGAVTSTAAYDIGSFVTGRPANSTTYAVGSTLAGSSIYNVSMIVVWNGSAWRAYAGTDLDTAPSLVNTGSWRCVSPAPSSGAGAAYLAALWVRYA